MLVRGRRVLERRVRSFDGTDIAYHVVGEGLPVLLANGLGGSWMAWRRQIEHFAGRLRFVSWDYRGLYRSGPPARPDAIGVLDHVRDALHVLDAEGIDRVVVVGWSMGVQVGLELFRRVPERVAGLVLANGVPGRPWAELAGGGPIVQRSVPWLLGAARAVPGWTQRITQRVVRWPELVSWAKRLGLAAPTLDDALWHELARSFADLDMRVYLGILERLGEHDATDVLAAVDVPTLVICGEHDRFTPPRAAERMARAIGGAELLVVPGGTHYVAVEYPELVNLRIEKFLAERGLTGG
ncbi:MAG: alpha/beta hydrolase [Myxococcota bacterium]|nr:alpha/beta hydrolase [Myxococcota bacterium]MDW8363355.1 alpha/beta hydrolase [Myxococcales bacterium]